MALAPVQSVILTREPEDNAELASLLESEGFEIVQYPCIETRFIKSAVPDMSEFDVIVFTSRRAVRGAFHNASADVFRQHMLAAVGEASAHELKLHGLSVNIVADPPNAENLAERLCAAMSSGGRILNIRGSLSLDILKKACSNNGLEVSEWIVYENLAPQLNPLERVADYAVFASPSAAERFFSVNSGMLEKLRCVAIGPTTLSAIKKLNASQSRMARGLEALDIFKCITEWRSGDER